MAEDFLPEIFFTAVQAFVPAGRAEGGERVGVAKGGSADAFGCLRADMDGGIGETGGKGKF